MASFDDIDTPDARDPQEPGEGWPPGARRALPMLLGVLLATAVPYGVVALAGEPGPADEGTLYAALADLRAWVPGDPAPFSTLFKTGRPDGLVALEGDGAGAAIGALAAQVEGEDDPDLAGPVALVRPVAAADVVEAADARSEAASDAAAGASAADGAVAPADGGPSAPGPAAAVEGPYARLVVPPEAWEGITAEIEDPSGAMAPFYKALARTALGEAGAVTRISQWGDSAIAADGLTGAARRLLQRQFGDAGHGFALVAAGNPWYRRKDIEWTSSGWKTQEFIRKEAADGRYGYGGVAAVGYQGASATWTTVKDEPVGTSASRFEVWYSAEPKAGKLEIAVDGEPKSLVETVSEAPEDRVEVVVVPDGPHAFRIKSAGGGAVRVFGVVVERDGPGVVYDGIGIIGAREARQLWADEAHFLGQLAKRRPDLMILMYGGNTLPDKISLASYRESFTQVVDRFRRGRPEAACLVMSPLDHGERHRGRVRTVPRQHELMAVQREVALAKGCAWYSIYDAMGGEGSVGKWFDTGLASGDLAHPTAKGSKVLGALWYKSVMKGFAGWVEAQKAAAP